MNNNSIIKKDLSHIQELLRELLRILETEGDGGVNYIMTELRRDISNLEVALNDDTTDLEEALNDLKQSFRSMFPLRGGLTDFFVWREDFKERLEANKPFNSLIEELKRIICI